MDHFRDELNAWVVRPYAEDLFLDFNRDAVDVVQEKRRMTFEKLQYADWMTVNEQREATGYETYDDEQADIPRLLLQTKAFDALATESFGTEETENDEESTEQEAGEGVEEEAEESEEEEVRKAQVKPLQTKALRYWKIDTEEKALLTFRQIERQRAVFEQFYTMEFRKHFRVEREAVIKAMANSTPENAQSNVEGALRKQAEGISTIFRGMYVNVSRFFFAFVYRSLLIAKDAPGFEEKQEPSAATTAADALRRLRIYLRAEIPARVGAVQETSSKQVGKLLREGIFGGRSTTDIADDIDKLYDTQFIPTRSARIAGTEVAQVSNASSVSGAAATGKDLLKYWITERDDRVRGNPYGQYPDSNFDHWHADKQSVPLDDPFLVSGEQLRFPGDTQLGASLGNVINCRCFLAYDEQ
jgi:hypothetical protein